MIVVVNPGGRIQLVYTDQVDLRALGGKRTIERASWVEPTPEGDWEVFWPNGQRDGPFPTREQALHHEQQVLQERLAQGRDL